MVVSPALNSHVMIRMTQIRSALQAKNYYTSLEKSDYYMSDQELPGKIQGLLAERIGISGSITKNIFYKLCDNINPVTGEKLTALTKENRTIANDCTFLCPKSVSLLNGLSKDDHILKAFEASVHETMADIEQDVLTRVRKSGQNIERHTGELLYASFVHQTARNVEESLSDPLLHCHCILFNCTHDEIEGQFKAIQYRDIKRDMPFYQARFHKRLADKMIDLGYQVEKTESAFEIKGIQKSLLEHFSKRTQEINKVAEEKGIKGLKAKSELGARTRSKKQKGLSMEDLKADWKRQIRELEAKGIATENKPIRFAPQEPQKEITASQCVDFALNHCLERASVCQDRRILAESYLHAIGSKKVSIEAITEKFEKTEGLIQIPENGKIMVTTKAVLKEEQFMVKLARQGVGKFKPLYKKSPLDKAISQQEKAIEHLLTTTDQVSIVMGAAGSGKTYLMKDAIKWMEKAGQKVTVVAPTAQASRGVLRDEGFNKAETVAKLLVDKDMQNSLWNGILWVDEAGLLGTKDMSKLLQISNDKQCRLIFGGDTRQHAAVVRGDALRILNSIAGIKTAEVNKIYRQKNEFYRSAVQDMAKGDILGGFKKLDSIGAIQTIDPKNPNEALVNDYIEGVQQKKSILVVSPTHKQISEVTDAIRGRLKSIKHIGKKDIEVDRLTNQNFTEAQKSDWRNFKSGHIVQFNQNVAGGIKRGSIWSIEKSTSKGIQIRNEKNQDILLPLEKSAYIDVFDKGVLKLSKGEPVRITRGGFDKNNTRLENGQILKITSINKKGVIELKNEKSKVKYKLDKDFGHLAHAYCFTSHSAQGKTCDIVLISQPSETFVATNSKQFYVSVSRGKEKAKIYTDDKEQLFEHVANMGNRQSAIELVGKRNDIQDKVQHQIRERLQINPDKLIDKNKTEKKIYPRVRKTRDYEPEL